MQDGEFFEREELKDNMQRKRSKEKLAMEIETVNWKYELEQQLAKPKKQTETKPMTKMRRLQVAEFSGEPFDRLQFWETVHYKC